MVHLDTEIRKLDYLTKKWIRVVSKNILNFSRLYSFLHKIWR